MTEQTFFKKNSYNDGDAFDGCKEHRQLQCIICLMVLAQCTKDVYGLIKILQELQKVIQKSITQIKEESEWTCATLKLLLLLISKYWYLRGKQPSAHTKALSKECHLELVSKHWEVTCMSDSFPLATQLDANVSSCKSKIAATVLLT